MITRLKIVFINVVIVCGSVAIAVVQWPEAVGNSGFGSNGYNQGVMGTILLALLMAGIPNRRLCCGRASRNDLGGYEARRTRRIQSAEGACADKWRTTLGDHERRGQSA